MCRQSTTLKSFSQQSAFTTWWHRSPSWLLFLHHNEIPWPRQLTRETVYLAYSFRDWVHAHHVREYGSKQAVMVLKQLLRTYMLIYIQKAKSELIRRAWAFETAKSTPTHHPQQVYFLLLPKQSHQLGPMYSSKWAYGKSFSFRTPQSLYFQ